MPLEPKKRRPRRRREEIVKKKMSAEGKKQFVVEHYPAIVRSVNLILKSSPSMKRAFAKEGTTSEELVNETVVGLLRSGIEAYDPSIGNASGFIYAVTKDKLMGLLRGMRSQKRDAGKRVGFLEVEMKNRELLEKENPSSIASQKEQHSKLLELMRRAEVTTGNQFIMLMRAEGHSFPEIGKMCRISTSSAKARFHQALDKIKRMKGLRER